LFKKIKEDKNSLSELKKTNRKLEEKITTFEQTYQAKKEKIKQKEKKIEELKNNVKGKLSSEDQKVLEELLEVQDDLIQSDSSFVRKQLRKNKSMLSSKLTSEEIELFCQLQIEITNLKLEIQKNFNKVSQTLHIDNRTINIQGFNIEGSNNTFTNPSVQGNTMKTKTITYEEEKADSEQQALIETPSPNKLLK